MLPNTPVGTIIHPDAFDTLTEEESMAVDTWVEDSKIGRRISWDMWRLRDEEAITLFMLKWGQ